MIQSQPIFSSAGLVPSRKSVRSCDLIATTCFPQKVLIASVVLVGSLGSPVEAANLTSTNASATVSGFDSALTVFRIDDGPDNVFISDFWFRTDSTTSANSGEVNLNELSLLTETQLAPNQVQFEAANNELSAVETWTLLGATSENKDVLLSAVLALSNISSAPIAGSLFYAADLDIAFDPVNPNDETTVLNANKIEVFDPVTGSRILTTVDPTPNNYQIYDGQFEVLFNFDIDIDGPTTLTNSPSIGTTVTDVPGQTDAGFAFGWDFELAPGESLTASVSHVAIAVPAPASLLSLFGLFTAGGLMSRPQKRRTR